ncbi:DUF4097 family beta strand repeat-containing protein [Streptomyces alboflavus]|uniref:DUF4097 family beta strand repeat-containing protein n=1 Tax=Streptomyces alboflavus TaxID=67267 RepID=UPI0036C5DE4B
MPTFDTPEPITATLQVELGVVYITAGERAITAVEVHPRTEGDEADLQAARDTKVTFSRGRLTIRTPKAAGRRGDSGSVAIEVRLPNGSRVNGSAATGDFTADGSLGECTLATMDGDIRLDRTGPARLRTERGDVTAKHIDGMAEIVTGSGQVRVDEIDGAAEIKNSNGNTWIDQVTGALHLKVANGNIFVGQAHADVASKSANGDTRIEQVTRGRVDLQTRTGDLEIGINLGTAALLDVNCQAGTVHNALGASDGPDKGAQTVRVRARTGAGDIVIRRAQPV